MKKRRGSRVERLAIGVVAALLTFHGLAAGAEEMNAAEKAGRLQALRSEFQTEAAENGLETERASELQRQIALLERTRSVDPLVELQSAPATPPSDSPAPAPPPESRDSEHMIADIQPVPDYTSKPGVGNPCGAYAVATILNSFGDNVEFDDVFDAIVPIKTGTSPHDIKSYLESHGHRVNDRNNGSLDDIAAGIDRGERMMLLLNTKDSLEGLHWAAVKGYRIKNGERVWIFEDTYFGSSKEVSEADLRRMWDSPIPGLGATSGYDNYYMTVGKEPPGLLDRLDTMLYGLDGRSAGEVLTSGLRDVTRGFSDTFGGDRSVGERIGGFFHMVGGGVLKIGGGIVGAIPTLAGNALQLAGESMMGWGARQWREGGFFGKVAGAGATVLGAITKGVGWVLTGVGAIVSGIVGALGDAVGAVGDAIGGAVDAVGDFVGGLF